MRSFDKVRECNTIINAWKYKQCPKCNSKAEKFIKHDGFGFGCPNCKTVVDDKAYLHAIAKILGL